MLDVDVSNFSARSIKLRVLLTCSQIVKMNNSLYHDFQEFKFSAKNKIYKDGAVELLQNFGTCFV